MRSYADFLARGQRAHGDKFDASALDARFIAHYESGQRIKVRTIYGSGPTAEHYVRTGTVGATTGWQPAFLLMHRSSDHGSSDVLDPRDEIIAVQHGRTYVPTA